jgi:hypothetical protein
LVCWGKHAKEGEQADFSPAKNQKAKAAGVGRKFS